MSAEWKEYKLGYISEWFSGGTPLKKRDDFWGGDIPWISASSMYGNRFFESNLKITRTGLSSGSRIALKNSILLLVRGSSLHHRIPVGIATRDVAFNQDVKALMVKGGIVDPWFLLYWFLANERKLLGMVESTGIGAGKLETSLLQKMKVRVPPKVVQDKIVSIAKSIDDKIELNRKMNATLEEMAQALFKRWFVDFEFPYDFENGRPDPGGKPYKSSGGKMIDSELGQIPVGWEVSTLSKMIELIGGGTPKKSEASFWDGDIPWFSVKDAPADGDVFVMDTCEKITQEGLDKSSTKLLPKGLTIISARGTVGRLALVGVPMAMNQSCYGVKGAEGIGPFYNYFNLKQAVNILQQNTHGAVFDTITQATFETVQTVKGDDILMCMFDEMVCSSMQKIKVNLQESSVLSEFRDTLLPKLLSGELDVSGMRMT